MKMDRRSGILLHVTSLPSRFGIGDLGPEAYRFADFLHRSGQRLWQILPLVPTDTLMGNSPYGSSSAFAGNPLLVSPEKLVEDGFLSRSDLSGAPRFPQGRVEYRLCCRLQGKNPQRGLAAVFCMRGEPPIRL